MIEESFIERVHFLESQVQNNTEPRSPEEHQKIATKATTTKENHRNKNIGTNLRNTQEKTQETHRKHISKGCENKKRHQKKITGIA